MGRFILIILFCASPAFAEDIFRDPKPNFRAFKDSYEGMLKDAPYALALPAISVARIDKPASIIVFYGLIHANLDRTARFVFVNETLNMICLGETIRQDATLMNATTCKRDGKKITQTRTPINPQEVDQNQGALLNPIIDLSGQTIGQHQVFWNAFTFPNPNRLIEEMKLR